MRAQFRSAKGVILAALLRHEKLSRTEMSEVAEVSPAAVTEVTQELLQKDVLEESTVLMAGRSRGRPTTYLTLKPSHAYFVGVSASGAAVPMVITDLQGQVVATDSPAAFETPAEFTAAVRKSFNALLKSKGVPQSRIRGVGVSITGIVDSQSGSCRYSAALDWRDVPVAEKIGNALRLPTWVDNDATAVAVAEKTFGRARDYQNFTSIILGPTIGSAHYIHDMLYRGHDGGAGEIGHVTVDPEGTLCRCGRKGCLDTVAGGTALLRAAKEHRLPVATMRDLETLAMQGDTKAAQILRKAGEALGSAAAVLVHLNNPQCLLMTDLEGFENGVFRTTVRQAIENNILPRYLGSTEIVFNDAEPQLLPRSAASMAALKYLASL